MNLFAFPLLLGTSDGASGGAAPAGLMQFAPLILIVVIFYFFIIRPQGKKQKETQRMLNAIKKGDKVVTIGGIHGVVQAVKEGTVVIKVDEDTKIEFTRSAVSQVNPVKGEEKKSDDKQIEDKNGGASEESK
ncbi:MAG: preprotein translocase subunit YajC [Spirochaetaceae bacterium]|jgi:preprotein translocase subunit YajC|nr:preprotein translocase subunit YajC [Spirochaetaceae bacterium]